MLGSVVLPCCTITFVGGQLGVAVFVPDVDVVLDVVPFAGLPLVGVLLQFAEEFFRVFRFLELAVLAGGLDAGAVCAGTG
jgi:hypothetical protein